MNRTQQANGLPVDRRDAVSAPLLDSARRDVEMALDALSSEAINSGGVWVLRFHVGFLARTIFTVKRTMFLTPIFFAPIPHPTRSKGAAEMTTENEWIEWRGGICPVDLESMIMVRLRDGWVSNGPAMACYHRWDHGRTPESPLRSNDIIAYRVVQS